MDTKQNRFIPNYALIPNIFFDEYLRYLNHRNGEQAIMFCLLSKANRWKTPESGISVDLLALDTGLDEETCLNALNNLVAFGLAVKTGDFYLPQMREEMVNIFGLRERRKRVRTRKALQTLDKPETKTQE